MTPKIQQVPVPTLPQAPPPAPIFGQQPTGQKPGMKSQSTTFINTGTALPQSGQTGKTQLIGQ